MFDEPSSSARSSKVNCSKKHFSHFCFEATYWSSRIYSVKVPSIQEAGGKQYPPSSVRKQILFIATARKRYLKPYCTFPSPRKPSKLQENSVTLLWSTNWDWRPEARREKPQVAKDSMDQNNQLSCRKNPKKCFHFDSIEHLVAVCLHSDISFHKLWTQPRLANRSHHGYNNRNMSSSESCNCTHSLAGQAKY